MKNYRNLTTRIKRIFEKFNYIQMEEYPKPYYKNDNTGKIYRVVGNNKLKELWDGASPTRYGTVRLVQQNGKPKTEAVHKIYFRYVENRENKPIPHHINGNKGDNRTDNLAPATRSENTRAYYEHKRNSKRK